jgi:two-component system, chemotaxis family, chemotaxis protein CheY
MELLQRLRESNQTARAPVLIFTTEANPTIVNRARDLGAKGWLIKPMKGDLLLHAVKKLAS